MMGALKDWVSLDTLKTGARVGVSQDYFLATDK